MTEIKTHLALFAGMGGFIQATDNLGIETIFANDSDLNCVKTLQKNFPSCRAQDGLIEDLSFALLHDINGLENKEVDLLSAGFPCQSFSQAGGNKGFDDARGKLFFQIGRLCKELKKFPKILLLENVPQLKLFNSGERLGVVIEDLRSMGYWVNPDNAVILNSKDLTGIPQSRERLFIVALHSDYFNSNPFSKNLFNERPVEKKLWDIVDNKNANKDASLYLAKDNKYYHQIEKEVKKYGKNRLYQYRRVAVRPIAPGICPTLTANMGLGGHNIPFVRDSHGIRKMTINEVLRLQGFEAKSFRFPETIPKGSCYSMVGNAVNPLVVEIVIKTIMENTSLKRAA